MEDKYNLDKYSTDEEIGVADRLPPALKRVLRDHVSEHVPPELQVTTMLKISMLPDVLSLWEDSEEAKDRFNALTLRMRLYESIENAVISVMKAVPKTQDRPVNINDLVG